MHTLAGNIKVMVDMFQVRFFFLVLICFYYQVLLRQDIQLRLTAGPVWRTHLWASNFREMTCLLKPLINTNWLKEIFCAGSWDVVWGHFVRLRPYSSQNMSERQIPEGWAQKLNVVGNEGMRELLNSNKEKWRGRERVMAQDGWRQRQREQAG